MNVRPPHPHVMRFCRMRPHRMRHRPLSLLVPLCLGLLLGMCAALGAAGCGARAEYAGAGVQVERTGWDTLHVRPRFVRRTALGGARPVAADSVRLLVLDASYDTLFAHTLREDARHAGAEHVRYASERHVDGRHVGASHAIPVPDRTLGDRERLLVEACGYLGGRAVCEQTYARASPKRIQAVPEITFPEGEALRRGSYRVRFTAERQRFDDTTWAALDQAVQPGGYLLAYVAGHPGGHVRIPLRTAGGHITRGRFDLRRHAGYDDFKFYLRSALFERDTADVRFEVHAGLGAAAFPLATAALPVHVPAEADREALLQHFVQQAGRQITRRLGADRARARAPTALVTDWSYDEERARYEAEVELRWHNRPNARRPRVLRGILTVDAETVDVEAGEVEGNDAADGARAAKAEGAPARFVATEASRLLAFRWRRVVDGPVMELRPLAPHVPEREEDGGEAERRTTAGARP